MDEARADFRKLVAEQSEPPLPERLARAKILRDDVRKQVLAGLARLDPEKTEVEMLLTEIEAGIGKWQRQINDAFLAELDVLSGKVTQLDKETDKIGRDRQRLEQCRKQQSSLFSEAMQLEGRGGVGENPKEKLGLVQGDLRGLLRKLARVEDEIKQHEKELSALAALPTAADSVTGLQEALKKFARDFADSPKAADLAKTAAQAPVWASVEEWEKLLRSWGYRVTLQAASEIAPRLQAIKAYRGGHPRGPFAEGLGAYEEYLTRAQRTTAPDSPWRSFADNPIRTPVMALLCVRTTSGLLYYVRKDAKVGRGSFDSVEVVLNPSGTKIRKLTLKGGAIGKIEESPQSKMADRISKILAEDRAASWETFGLDIAEAVRTAEAVDSVLRMKVLVRALSCLESCCWGVKEEVQAIRQRLATYDTTDVPWMDPEDATAKVVRERMAKQLAALGSFQALKAAVQTKHRTLIQAPLLFRSAGRGIALRDEKGAWEVKLAAALGPEAQGAAAVVVLGQGATAPAILRQIGTVKGGKVSVDQAQATAGGISEGTLVFVRRREAPE